MTRRSTARIERDRNLVEIRRQQTTTRFRGLSPLELYDVWGRCHAYYSEIVPPMPHPQVMEVATMDGTIFKWFPCIGQSLEAIG